MQASLPLEEPNFSDASLTTPLSSPARAPKRRRHSVDDDSSLNAALDSSPSAKRAKFEDAPCALASPPETETASVADLPVAMTDVEKAQDAIHYQFGLEILLKHDELRLINQELAKCQVALEQLRRCHLIPYPVACPTPDQMVDVANGKGPALRTGNESVPQWAPPFGVVDGPYARHYAKWLIPDPKFDGMQSEWQPAMDTARGRASAEGRATRNSFVDTVGASKPRPMRGPSSQKLHSLSHGYPQPKDKAGPCVLKRSDGQTVKLVCLDCQRENFSSTQGFINHCRIAHKRDFKSHEEAAVHSGHPIQVGEPAPGVAEEKERRASSIVTPSITGSVHPFAAAQLSDQQAYVALQSRIAASLEMYHQGKLPAVTSIPTSASEKSSTMPSTKTRDHFVSDSSTPFLSRLMQQRNFQGNLGDIVKDAKQKLPLEDVFSVSEDLEDADNNMSPATDDVSAATRAPIVKRVPAGMNMSPAPRVPSTRPASSKGPPCVSPAESVSEKVEEIQLMAANDDVDMDADLSPNTVVSNNAPSLVSDDGEYDDSDDGSSITDASVSIDAESVSDVAEINIDEDHDPRSIRHHRTASGAGTESVGLRKEEPKHVTFVQPVNNTSKRARKA